MSMSAQWVPYCGAAPSPAEWLGRWNLDPLVLAATAALAALAVALRSCPGSRPTPGAAAAIVFAALFVSPLCALTSALFSARVVHHVVLVAVLAPLLVAAVPARWLRGRGSLIAWTAAQAGLFWAWHLPALYAAALRDDAVYAVMQASLAGVALGFWRAIRGAAMPSATAALLATMVQMGLLGALLTFSAGPLYAPHLATTLAWGLTPLEDQQLGGLVMWAPAALLYLGAALAIVGRWLGREMRPAAAAA